jgi:hypothetical protein
MTPINRLSGIDSISLGDLLAIFSQSEGDARKISLSQLRALLTVPAMGKQYAAPNANGQTVAVLAADSRVVITPNASYAQLTIALPVASDGQKVVVNCTQSISELSFTNGTVNGAPVTLFANGFFTLEFDGVMGVWYRVA